MIFIRNLIKTTSIDFAKPTFKFCSGVQKNDAKVQSLQDWQYCKRITQQLKSNRVNSAISLLFQSYFNNKILDIQIYNSVFQSINEAGLAQSYSQIVYQIYREHFPPNSLLLTPMNKLTSSHNQSLIEQLKRDYEAIHQPYPQKKPTKKQPKTQKINPAIKQSTEQTPKIPRGRNSRKIDLQVKPVTIDLKNITPDIQLIDPENVTPQDFIKMRLAAQLKNTLEQINSELNFSKIHLFDVEIEMNNSDQEETMNTPEQYEYEEDEENMDITPSLGLFELDISKIKIGRVQFISDNNRNDKNQP